MAAARRREPNAIYIHRTQKTNRGEPVYIYIVYMNIWKHRITDLRALASHLLAQCCGESRGLYGSAAAHLRAMGSRSLSCHYTENLHTIYTSMLRVSAFLTRNSVYFALPMA